MSISLATKGVLGGLGGGGGPISPPGRPCVALASTGAASALFTLTPPTDPDYAGTMISYTKVGTCVGWLDAGPEAGNLITVVGLESGIYVFVPYSYDNAGAYGKPGNPILASFPENLINMEDLSLYSCVVADVWARLNACVDARDLATATAALDLRVGDLINQRTFLESRLDRIEAEIAILKRKL